MRVTRSAATPATIPISLLVCAAGLFVAGCSKETAPAARPAPQVSVLTVQARTIPVVPSFVAQTESSQQVDIVARVSGFLDNIAYREGELVKEGQLHVPARPQAVPGAARRR